MKIILPEGYKETPDRHPEFETPDFVNLMDKFIERAHQLEKNIPKVLGGYDHLGIVGIGGSQVQPFVFEPHAKVSVTHLEVPDPYVLNKLYNHDSSETRIIYCSRSGSTKEVLSFIPFLLDYESLVVTNGDPLLKIANELGWLRVSVSHDISGRFAIQNELGIVPMIAMGLDSVEFLSSLKKGYKNYFKRGSTAETAAVQFYNLEKNGLAKVRILPSGFFTKGLGILFTQLINESVPKNENDLIDASLHIMPRGAHSDLQRWYGAVKDSFIFTMSCEKYDEDVESIAVPKFLKNLVPGIKAKAGQHLNITTKAVEDTFPGPVFRMKVENDSISETAQAVSFLHALTVRLAQLKGSNPFDQPAVQQYKERASQIYKKL
ncbi:MAG: hypothetical protein ACTSR2_12785 [Candidatus Hodarchaeales archaeon]